MSPNSSANIVRTLSPHTYHEFKRNTLLDDEDLAANHDIDTAACQPGKRNPNGSSKDRSSPRLSVFKKPRSSHNLRSMMDSHFTSRGGPPKIIQNPHRGEQVGQVFGEIKSEDEYKIKLEEENDLGRQ